MSTDILGKVGQLTGAEFKNLRVSIGQTYATKVSLGTVVNTIDFTPYATKVSLGQTNSSVASNTSGISGLDTSKASKVSLNSYATGASIFDLLKATRAELGELKVTGETTIVNTQTVEVSDNIIELNLASDGGETAQTSGIQINRGESQQSIVSNYSYGTFTWDSAETEDFGTGNTPKPVYRSTANSGYNSTLRIVYSSTAHSGDGYSQNGWFLVSDSNAIEDQVTTGTDDLSTSSNFTLQGGTEDKAKILWNDNTSKFELKVGTALTDLDAKKIYYSNVFLQESDLPSASTYHGMFAHVHGTGKAYFSHAGAWHELISETGGQTINGNLTLTGDLAVSAGTNIKVNNVELGDFSSFSNAFSNALT